MKDTLQEELKSCVKHIEEYMEANSIAVHQLTDEMRKARRRSLRLFLWLLLGVACVCASVILRNTPFVWIFFGSFIFLYLTLRESALADKNIEKVWRREAYERDANFSKMDKAAIDTTLSPRKKYEPNESGFGSCFPMTTFSYIMVGGKWSDKKMETMTDYSCCMWEKKETL